MNRTEQIQQKKNPKPKQLSIDGKKQQTKKPKKKKILKYLRNDANEQQKKKKRVTTIGQAKRKAENLKITTKKKCEANTTANGTTTIKTRANDEFE